MYTWVDDSHIVMANLSQYSKYKMSVKNIAATFFPIKNVLLQNISVVQFVLFTQGFDGGVITLLFSL